MTNPVGANTDRQIVVNSSRPTPHNFLKEALKYTTSAAVGSVAGVVFSGLAYVTIAIPFVCVALVPKEKATIALLESTVSKVIGAYVVHPLMIGGSVAYGTFKGYEMAVSTYENLTSAFG